MKHGIKYFVLAITCIFSMAACNTIEGVGKDLKSAGEAIEEEAAD